MHFDITFNNAPLAVTCVKVDLVRIIHRVYWHLVEATRYEDGRGLILPDSPSFVRCARIVAIVTNTLAKTIILTFVACNKVRYGGGVLVLTAYRRPFEGLFAMAT